MEYTNTPKTSPQSIHWSKTLLTLIIVSKNFINTNNSKQ